ncbi:Bug family tripartite tricarboxylate transporter substrate binding protein [Lacisediminimonas profundi]|uniref:Bug family tripartite tricarboxylate transporter substrate binding protein n=1 Tax=Lacisediminimonas profundi TaxID=2603856 RepID=UPI001F4F31DF|nr:tripartite tricarboxylate transporter substrate binding protein [Lacisediminimonas profundi]
MPEAGRGIGTGSPGRDGRQERRRTLLLAMLASILPRPLLAQSGWPDKPIRLIVAYGAGGNADIRARQLAQYLAPALGQPVIVENKPGAGGNIGTEIVARAAPDGYTIGIGSFAPLAVNKALFGNLKFDPLTDLAPVVLTDSGPLVLCVPAASRFANVDDIVKAARARPGTLTFASGGIGGSHHLSAELLKQAAGIDMIHVPYKGGSAGTTDLLGGNVDMMFEQMYSALPNIRAGKLRPLGITSAKRAALLPDVPTFAELGLPRVIVTNWQGVIAPKGTPQALVERLNRAINKILAEPAVHRAISEQANDVLGGSPEEFAAFIRAESAKWSTVVRQGNIRP